MGFFSHLGSIGSAIAGLIEPTGWLNHSSQKSMAKYTGQLNLRNSLAQMQEQDKLERAYAQHVATNSPSWSVEGLRSAGLNPILAASGGFSQSTASLGAGGSVPSSTGSSSGGLGASIDLATKINQNNILEKQSDLLESEKALKDANTKKVLSEIGNIQQDTLNKQSTRGLSGPYAAANQIGQDAVKIVSPSLDKIKDYFLKQPALIKHDLTNTASAAKRLGVSVSDSFAGFVNSAKKSFDNSLRGVGEHVPSRMSREMHPSKRSFSKSSRKHN
jgi:hypothetical protein